MTISAPANPFAPKQARLRQALLEAVTEDDIAAVTGKLVELARDGDLRAIRLLLHYTVGKPGDTSPSDEPRPKAPAGMSAAPPPALPPRPADLIREQVRKEAAADTKRKESAPLKPMSSPRAAVAATEPMRLVNLPGDARS